MDQSNNRRQSETFFRLVRLHSSGLVYDSQRLTVISKSKDYDGGDDDDDNRNHKMKVGRSYDDDDDNYAGQ